MATTARKLAPKVFDDERSFGPHPDTSTADDFVAVLHRRRKRRRGRPRGPAERLRRARTIRRRIEIRRCRARRIIRHLRWVLWETRQLEAQLARLLGQA